MIHISIDKLNNWIMSGLLVSVIALFSVINCVFGHGYMSSPINRASRWRLDEANYGIPHNYEDNQFFCGGYSVQYEINEGKCGPCGDDWRDEVPRSNENGGIYGNGVIVATYISGSIIQVDVMITANHLGHISYQLCKLSDPDAPETEECFEQLPLLDGSYTQTIDKDDFNVTSYIQLPDDVVCSRCVLRWHYNTGNSWGVCSDGTGAIGCGSQETFRSCADIRILPRMRFGLRHL
ncbi:hypothetical protein ABEB36_005750 [Hypothenemus hampei]|uniref:Chitin-binding type-4 domain-containing protein n=1 Tax=Hypothenemus hampei TaxID=57062 RepID=A0ABD1EZB1_HYPHA